MQLTTIPPIRSDAAGDGHYGTKRGSRTHTGSDLAMLPGTIINAPESGVMGHYGWPYGDDASYRIVDYQGDSGTRYRFFYAVQCGYPTGDKVAAGQPIAIAQDVTLRYPDDPDMTPHVHLEVFNPADELVNPETYTL